MSATQTTSPHACRRTIANMVFALGGKTLPEEVIKGVRECDVCFTEFYGEHLTTKFMETHKVEGFDHVVKFHFDHCQACQKEYRRIHPVPNKMGRSSRGYLKMIS